MKRALTFLAALMLVGCGEDKLTGAIYPQESFPAPETRTVLRGMVVDEEGQCVDGATVQITGQWGADAIEQAAPCGLGNLGEDLGFTVEDVLLGVGLTIRSSAPGYETQETSLVPSASPFEVVFLTLTRTPELRRR